MSVMKYNEQDILEVSNLGMHFGGIHALENITFQVARNTITALIGPNGAGKTTLFNCLTGFYRATSGTIHFYSNQQHLEICRLLGETFTFAHAINPARLCNTLYYKMFGGSHLVARAGIARTFQNIRLFKEMTVIENLLVAQHIFAYRNLIGGLIKNRAFKQWEKEALDTAFHWLDQFKLADHANRLAGELSYGQQRHLEIARCLCIKPTLLCLDEPAAGLNPNETDQLSQRLQAIKQDNNLTILLIEHDMSMVMQISDHIIVLDHGDIICQGDAKTIRDDKKVIAAYLGIDEHAAA